MLSSPKRGGGSAAERAAKARKQEADAKLVSDQIDAMLEEEKNNLAKHRSVIRILLLGQSESGKSTVLKNFQLMYARDAFVRDRDNWRGVILLNVVRCMQRVVEALIQADEHDSGDEQADEDAPPPLSSILTDSHRRKCMRLRASLDLSEKALKARISPSLTSHLPRSRPSTAEQPLVDPEAETELAVQAHTWNTLRLESGPKAPSSSRRLSALPNVEDLQAASANPKDPLNLTATCRQDMLDLWFDPVVKEILAKRKVRWQEWPGFFLNDLDRVTAQNYRPIDDDVVRARLKTMGVSDYSFVIDQGPRGTYMWRVLDVGGSRTQRHQWMQYFEDASAVIFLAPLSAFDQKLAEDRSVNRLEDSLLLWKSVCASKLLANVDFILFLNKVDILSAKLRSGVRVQKYVKSYRDRPNTAEAAAKYFKDKFQAIQREYSPKKRPFYCYLTSVIDTKATNAILDNVGESLLRKNLQTIGVL